MSLVAAAAFVLLPAAGLALPQGPPDEPREAPPKLVVGLLPAEDPAVTRSLRNGLRMAFADVSRDSGLKIELVVAEVPSTWGSIAGSAVQLVEEQGATVLIAPPERRSAHAIAQVATRAQAPVLAACRAPTLTAAGSRWVFAVVGEQELQPCGRFVAAYDLRYGRGQVPDEWAVAGFDAGLAILAAWTGLPVADSDTDAAQPKPAETPRAALASALRKLKAVQGAAGAFRFDSAGRRAAPTEG